MSRLKRIELARCSKCGRELALEPSGLCLTCELEALREENAWLKVEVETERRKKSEALLQLREMSR